MSKANQKPKDGQARCCRCWGRIPRPAVEDVSIVIYQRPLYGAVLGGEPSGGMSTDIAIEFVDTRSGHVHEITIDGIEPHKFNHTETTQ